MRTRITRLGKAATAAAALAVAMALPAAGSAEYYVPPGNSAATQYTEAYPTAGGHRNAEQGRTGGGRSPSQALGEETASGLESEGAAGREAAEFAAETAPGAASRGAGADPGGRGGEAGQAGGGPSGSTSDDRGSSGVGEVLGQATGTSSGEMGLLLPVIIIGAIASGLAFLWWRKSPAS